jgi:hypothetical protein
LYQSIQAQLSLLRPHEAKLRGYWVNIPSNTQGYLEIRDLEGRKILSKILNDNTNKIDLSTFNNGIYIFTIKTNSNKILRGKLAIVSN